MTSRQNWLGVLARAKTEEILACLEAVPELPAYIVLRTPECGMTMLRGRMGGGGAAFNFGEMTVSRCTVRDAEEWVGHGYAAGRDLAQVELIARLDAVLQNARWHLTYYQAVVQPLLAVQAARRAAVEAKAVGTEVKFFTLATMRS